MRSDFNTKKINNDWVSLSVTMKTVYIELKMHTESFHL